MKGLSGMDIDQKSACKMSSHASTEPTSHSACVNCIHCNCYNLFLYVDKPPPTGERIHITQIIRAKPQNGGENVGGRLPKHLTPSKPCSR